MKEKLYYRIGLDIGIASVGWAVLENNSDDEPVRIVDMGVRIFDKAEIPKTGDPLAGPRREARTARRRLRRRKHRLDRLKWLFEQVGLIETEAFMKRYYSGNLPDVYKLRYEALDRKLADQELAQVLLHIAKHRGFKSTRKSETLDKENGAVLKATSENQKRMQEKGYRTVGEMLYCDTAFKVECPWSDSGYILAVRNKAEDYRHTILRDMLEEEVKTIFLRQRELGNAKATEQFEEKYLEIMLSQRSFDMGPGKQPDGTPSPYAINGFGDRVGKCTFEPEEMRAAKAAYSAELFVAIQKINHLRLVEKNGEGRFLTQEERQILIELLHRSKEIKYAAVRTKLGIGEKYRFNTLNYSSKTKNENEDSVKATEKAKFIAMPNYYELMKRIGHLTEELSEEDKTELLDKIATILTLFKNDDSRTEQLKELGLSGEDIEKVLELSPSKFLHVSVKAIKKLMPYLREGMIYDKACEAAGYDFKADDKGEKLKLLKGERIQAVMNEITNPVVKRSVSQTVKVINAIILKYGSPQAINIELAREMAKNFDERRKMEKQMNDRFDQNDAIKKQIQELGKVSPTGLDIVKYRLWEEQQGICLYSGKKIPLEQLFEPGYDIDHILPYSITFDDSYRNKVLVTSQENRQKGNRTPFEYFGEDQKRWKSYEANVLSLVKDYRKQQKLLKKHITEEECRQFKERNLNDTKYITRVMYNMIRQNLELEPYHKPEQKKKQIYAVNGVVTAYLRKRWGVQRLFEVKNRDIDTHHAVDAVVIGCCTDGMIHKISRSVKARELQYALDSQFVDEETGEVFDRAHFTREEWDEKFGVKIAPPWPWFMNELNVRIGDDPLGFLQTHSEIDREIRYPAWMYEGKSPVIRPIFVSRMPNHKVSGAAHADTIRSPRHYKENGMVVSRVALTDLKLGKDGEIEGYYNKESDLLLYGELKRRLQFFGNDAKKAFAEPLHKPKSDGTEGPIVKKVKVMKKLSLGVEVNGGQGIAENGSMVRIDVFCVEGKYYFVPIYTADVVKKVLPNRAASQGKSYFEWREVEDKDFLFSLYSRDLIHIKSKKGVKTNLVNGGQIMQKEIFAYYIGADISTASINGMAHDNSFKFRGLGIQNMERLEKCQVDVLGNVTFVKDEKRMGF